MVAGCHRYAISTKQTAESRTIECVCFEDILNEKAIILFLIVFVTLGKKGKSNMLVTSKIKYMNTGSIVSYLEWLIFVAKNVVGIFIYTERHGSVQSCGKSTFSLN